MTTTTPDVTTIIARLEELASPADAAGMARFGIRGACVLGVPVKTLRTIARETGRSHALAKGLWASGIHEARILASIVAEPKRVDPVQMERWVADLDSWDLCDQCCTNHWVRTSFARDTALAWSEREEEFVKRWPGRTNVYLLSSSTVTSPALRPPPAMSATSSRRRSARSASAAPS